MTYLIVPCPWRHCSYFEHKIQKCLHKWFVFMKYLIMVFFNVWVHLVTLYKITKVFLQ